MKIWQYNSKDDFYELLITQDDEEDISILKFRVVETIENEIKCVFVSELANVEYDELMAHDIKDAKEQLEDYALSYVIDKIDYWEKLEKQLSFLI